jgi:hypothetical protein
VGLLAVVALFASPVAASASEGTRVAIESYMSGRCVSVPGDVVVAGARMDQWDCGLYPDQYWYVNPSASHSGWFYLQPAQDDTLCATYSSQGGTNPVTLEPCGVNAANGNFNTQLWTATANGVIETAQGLDMGIAGTSMDNNANIDTWPYGPYPDQFWTWISE